MLAVFFIAVTSLATAVASSSSPPPLLFSSWIPVGRIAPANQTSIFVQNVSAAFAISPSRVVLTAVNASYISFYFEDSTSSSSSAAAAWLTVPQYSSDALNYFLLNMTSSDLGYLMGLPGALHTNDTLRAAALVRPPALLMPAPPVSTTSPVQLQLGSEASADVALVRNTVASCLGISSTNIRTARLEDVSGSGSGIGSAVSVTFFSSPLVNASQGFSAPLSDADLAYFATVNAAALSACVANGLNVSASSSSSDAFSTAPHLVEVLFDDDSSCTVRTQLTQLLAALPPSATVTFIEGHRAVLRVFANSTRTAAGVVQAALAAVFAVFVVKPPPTPSSKPSTVLLGVGVAVAAVIVVAIVVSATVVLSRRRATRRRGTHMASSSSPLPTKADVMMLEDE